jgi:hypothetical protein
MTVKAENCKVMEDVIGGVVIDVVDLYRLTFDPTDAASSVGQEESLGCQFWRDGFSVFLRWHVTLVL